MDKMAVLHIFTDKNLHISQKSSTFAACKGF